SEDKVEFKEAKGGNISYNGGGKPDPKKRRKCILGYVAALANEGGGYLVFGVKEDLPHQIVGSNQNIGAVGQLESDIYRDLGIRVLSQELFEGENRVLVLKIPGRPFGTVFKFEDVPLMRVGDELKPMSDQQYLKIIQEREPDFSQSVCEGVTIDDLDNDAITSMKKAYARKQNNNQFLTLSNAQILSDLDLIVDGKVTNAAVILLGKEDTIKRNIPQAIVQFEYRQNESQITFDGRYTFTQPFYLSVESLWETINTRNGTFPIQDGPYIFNIPYFNKEVIREAINNAIAHRDYRISSEIVIKQYPTRLDVINPGGFPHGVSLENLLTTSSTPRNRLLTDVLQKTGIVERSGQGVDKIYYQTLKEGKSEPDYSQSDFFQVELRLSAVMEDRAFALFIESIQSELPDNGKLSVHDIICLNNIRKGEKNLEINKEIIINLLDKGLIEKRGRTSGVYYVLSKSYYEFVDEKGKYSKTNWDSKQAMVMILQHLGEFEKAKMKDFIDLFQGRIERRKVRYIVGKFVSEKVLAQHGTGKGTFYQIGENFKQGMDVINQAIEIGMKKLKEDGKL
ncbi:MAG: ATP-binding protein, partial [Salibacteraceae bacterium]